MSQLDRFEIKDVILLVFGFILGWFTNWYFYRKQKKENESQAKLLKEIRQYIGAQIRLGEDKRGKIVENPDGTIAIEWYANLQAHLTLSANAKAEKVQPTSKNEENR